MVFFMAVVWRTFWLFVLCLLHRSHYTCGQWSKWHFSYPDLYNVTSMSDVDIERREAEQENRLKVEIRQWYKIEKKPIYPFRTPDKCWHGYDGIDSKLQMELDRICTMQNGGVTSCAQCEANPVRTCRCYNIFQHDYTSNDGGCINNCGQIIPCVGGVVQKEYIHEIKAATLNSLIRKNCVMSSLQKAMDGLCGEGLIMRIHSGEYGCYRDDEVSYDIYSMCLDECGINVPCMGYKNGLNPIRTINPMAVDWDRYNRNCVCVERLSSFSKRAYVGCLSKTASGKKCKTWADVDGLMLTRLHGTFIRNYCRELSTSGIQCYNEDNVLEACTTTGKVAGKGPLVEDEPTLFVQPGAFFDIWVKPYIPNYEIKVKFFAPNSVCGEDEIVLPPLSRPFDYQPYDVYTGRWSIHAANQFRNPYPSLREDFESYYIIKGFKALGNAHSKMRMCGCTYSSIYQNQYANNLCTRSAEYIVDLGVIVIMGSPVPEKPIKHSSGMDAVVNVHSVGTAVISMIHMDQLNAILNKDGGSDYMVSIDALFEVEEKNRQYTMDPMYDDNPDYTPYVKTLIPRSTIYTGNTTTLTSVSKPGVYFAIFQETDSEMASRLDYPPRKIVGHHVFIGFEKNLEFKLVGKENETLGSLTQSLFIRSWNITAPPIAIILSKITDGEGCSSPFGYSDSIYSVLGNETEEMANLWRIERINVNKERWSEADIFDVCIFRENGSTKKLGSGKKITYVDHELSHLYPGLNEMPNNISTHVVQDEWDIFLIHGNTESDTPFHLPSLYFANNKSQHDLLLKFIENKDCKCSQNRTAEEQYYPQVLSFWCLKESNRVMIFGMTPTRATPTFLGKFIVERPVAFELLVNYESVTALVISEGKSNVLHYKVGMSITSDNMLHFALSLLPSKCPKHRCVKLAAASDMKVINYSLECRQDFMVIVTDAGDNCIILMNSELGETDRICHKPTTIYEHIQEPGKIACTKVPDLPCTSLNANIARQETVNCFITQKRSGVMLWIIVDLRNETMSLEDIYSGELYNPSEEPGTSSPTTAIPLLVYPDSIETVTYDSIDFVYLIESENSVIRTFLIYHRDERKQLVYYGNSKPDNAPYSTYLGIKGIQMSKREENSAVKDDYLLLFRRPESLGFGNQMGGYVTVLNIQETIRVSDFDYTIPHWIIVGTDHYIEPTIKCSTSHFNGLTRYDLEVVSDPWHSNTGSSKCVEMGPPPREPLDALGPAEAPLELVGNAAVRNAISVSHDGKLTISVRDINRITVRIRITAVGPIDAKCIYKTLSLACPDGHFFHNDKVTKKRGCKVCPVGYYNSILLIEKDLIKWGECTQCPENESTIDVGAASPSQCICSPGYYLVNGSKPRCQPCPAGTWKSVVGAQECTGGGCYKNSDSDVIGSTTEEGRKCACRRGYYYRHLAGYAKECVPCEEGYFCPGGFHGKKLPCPVNMTTHIVLPTKDASGQYNMASTVNDCVCKPGFQPAKVERIDDITTEEHKLMLEVETELFLHAIENADVSRLICIPCPYNTYKVLKGDSTCIPCPPKTFRDPNNTNDILTCNKCEPGYFETNDPSTPCEECPPNHICVGSDPLDPEMMKYKGKKTMCHKNAITIPPYDKNINMTHCLCIQGFTVSKDLSSNCEAVPKGTYKDVIGNVAPIDCPEGSYTAEPGASSKKDCVCKKGMYFDQTNKRCTICPVGKYCLGGRTKNDEHTPPTDCGDINSVTKEPGASSHTDCLCKPGFYLRHEGQSGCVECPENTFKDHVSNESCTDCDDHSSTNGKIGAISKEHCVCAPGYYFNGTCQACRHPKKYCPGGSTRRDIKTGEIMYETKAPVDCPPNTEIPPGVDTADSVESCKCGKGFALAKNNEVRMIKSCVPCEPGTYKSSVMDSSCNGLCTQNATSKAGAHSPAQCYCQRGYYYLAGGICAPCVEGARCDGGVVEVDEVGADADGNDDQDDDVVVRRTHINPVPIEGYFLDKINQELRKPDDWRFIMCPIKGACLGEKGCSESMTAYLCAECKTGYTNNFKKGTLCTKCPKTMTNVVLTIAWYLGLLLVNIVMACLNVSAGYNRRSIHSVVIKIALNYGICMSVLNVINFGDLALPAELKSYTLRWFKVIHRESSVVHTSIDCLLQHWFGMTHAVSFFYSMLFIACLPVILLVVVTVLMWVILELFKIKRHHVTRSKLALLYQSSLQGMHYLADRLRDEYANERLFLIFRYIPLPGETRWVRFKHFLEDMIPIYVTVLFSVHGNTTSQMLSLLDCTCIHLGQSVPSKYMLRPAMSIRCSLDPGSAYFPYLLLGLGGLIFWGFGIPFFSYIVLLVNRKKLYAPDVRMKYGFLHNGYQQEYWFWEAIVFTRKSLVLVIGSIVIVPSENTSASRMWMALAVAVVFLIIQLIYKPFDERDYFVLGRLESHSMISWTMTLIFSLFAIEGEFSAYNNMYLLSITSIINFCFISEVALELGLAYCDNIRFRKDQCSTSIISKINRSLAAISEKRKSREPLIVFNELNRTIDLCAPKSNQWYVFDERNRRLTYSEKVYFTHIVTEVINFSNIHMKLDIIPTDFPEFITRLAFAVNFHELNKKRADDIVRSLADGNLDEIVNLVMFEARQPKRRLSSLQSFASNINNEDDEHIVPPGLLFDKEVINEGIPLSDFYMALSIIKMKDIYNVVKTYAAFKVLRINADREEVQEQYEKLEQMKDLLRRIRDPDNKTLEEIFCSDEDIEKERRDVEELERKLELLKNDPLGALEEFGDDTFDTQIVQVGFRKNPNIRNYSP